MESKRQLFILYLYVETKQKLFECNTCSNDDFTKFDVNIFIIIMNFN
jgi:hypothetical protein